ncbi:MAG: DEAD/DEAH box helicase, partial [Spirochaetaceae bacterium]|nr:DEAD/DEAH box helicase [Spirochaetaceae bacterium]
MHSFTTIGLTDTLAAALASFGFAAPTSAQAQAIPLLLAKRDLFLESETGTGKTFAYLAPALQLIGEGGRAKVGEPVALIAAPTQELAVQIGREAERLVMAAGASIRVAVLLGGTALDKQLGKLKDKPDIIVGTLGRLRDLLAVKKLSAKALRLLVLDEADRLFAPETSEMAVELLRAAPPACPRALVSATLPQKVRRAALKYLTDPAEISADDTEVLSSDIEHWCFYCDGRKRLDFVRKLEAAVRPERCLMFLSLATRIESVAERLAAIGLPIAAIHAGLDKEARRTALERFATGQIRYLLTSDLGARGLDIAGITHVLSLDLPEEPTIYTHRAGRTGRAGAKGVSIVLADGIELERASRMAVRSGFVFRCKIMEAAQIFEPTSEEFFARSRAAEDDRLQAKASKLRDPEARRPSFRRTVGGGGSEGGREGGAVGGSARRSYSSEGGAEKRRYGAVGGREGGREGDAAGGSARRSFGSDSGPEKRRYGAVGGREGGASGGPARRCFGTDCGPEKRR